MRPSSCKSTLTVMRSVAGITMQQLADVIGCNRQSLQQIELGRLKMSKHMAERISGHTGVSMNWLLANRYRVPPVCLRDPDEPFTREVYRQTRAQVAEPRVHPLDVRAMENVLAIAYHQLNAAAEEAYRADENIRYSFEVREFLEALGRKWPLSAKLQPSMDVAQTAAIFHKRLEKVRRAKQRSKGH